jgi:hypothetical protein
MCQMDASYTVKKITMFLPTENLILLPCGVMVNVSHQ